MASLATIRSQNERLDLLALLQHRPASSDAASARKTLATIETRVADLRAAHLSLLEVDERERTVILYTLQSAIGAAIATAITFGAATGAPVPATHGDAFLLLAERGVIPHHLAIALVDLASTRNAIAFDYLDLDLANVRDAIEQHLDDLLSFVAAIRPLL